MRPRVPSRPLPRGSRRFVDGSGALLALLVIALAGLLMTTALRAGASTGSAPTALPTAAAELPDQTPTAPSAAAATGASDVGAGLATVAPTTLAAPEAAASGVLLRVQPATALRALARPGPEGRLLVVVLAGLLLAIIGRRPTARRPVLVPLPASAAPGLGLCRRGPPLR